MKVDTSSKSPRPVPLSGDAGCPIVNVTKAARTLSVLCLTSLLAACKVAIEVPDGGSVVSASGAYACEAGTVCI